MKLIPKSVFLVSGVGHHEFELESFEEALRSAGIEKFNLVTVSSIIPPNCKLITPEEGVPQLSPGEIVFCVMSRISSNEPHRKMGTSVGCAFPSNPNDHGYISEYHSFGKSTSELLSHSSKMAEDMFTTFRHKPPKNVIHKTKISVKQTSKWTTVISVAVFIL